jgi:hypothetical protein
MADKKSKVELKTCKICKKSLASDVKPCIHCGTAEPFDKPPEKKHWLYIISAILIFIIWLAALRPGCLLCGPPL